jgi:hypothetical protein
VIRRERVFHAWTLRIVATEKCFGIAERFRGAAVCDAWFTPFNALIDIDLTNFIIGTIGILFAI